MKSDYEDQISTNLMCYKYVCILCFFEYSLRSKKFNKFDRIPHHWDMIIIRKNKRHLAVSSLNRSPFSTIFPPFSRSHVIVHFFPDSLYLTIRLLLSISTSLPPPISSPIILLTLSSAIPKAVEFGISADNVFGFWDWVGGRYTVCSAVGVVPLALQVRFT